MVPLPQSPSRISVGNTAYSGATALARGVIRDIFLGVASKLLWGRSKKKDWCKLAESLIEFAGETDLLKYLLQWCDEHKYPQSSAAEVRKEALQLHTARIFDNPQWVGFVPFNTKYRPTALDTAHIVLVRMDCCPEAGSVTQEQIDHAYEGQISCPHCGRWNNFTILKKEIDVDDDSPWETDCEI